MTFSTLQTGFIRFHWPSFYNGIPPSIREFIYFLNHHCPCTFGLPQPQVFVTCESHEDTKIMGLTERCLGPEFNTLFNPPICQNFSEQPKLQIIWLFCLLSFYLHKLSNWFRNALSNIVAISHTWLLCT